MSSAVLPVEAPTIGTHNNNNGSMKDLDYLLQINKDHAEKFNDPSVAIERRRYREVHRTEIAAFKCMDGRLHLPLITETPPGVIQPWRNIGGRFNLGWFGFQESIARWVDYSISRGRRSLAIITYHYSRGDHHRGCAGFGYDTDAARTSAMRLKAQFDKVFGNTAVHAIVCGIETDLEAIILHGEKGEVVDLAELVTSDRGSLKQLIAELYPSMHKNIRRDFLPLVVGNISHIAKVRASNRPVIDVEHCEWILGVGRGFDWLHTRNSAFLIGPFDPDMGAAIITAGKLSLGNIRAGRIEGEIVLMAAASYRDVGGYEPGIAAEKAKFYRQYAYDILAREVPDIIPHLEQAAVRVDANTRRLELLERF